MWPPTDPRLAFSCSAGHARHRVEDHTVHRRRQLCPPAAHRGGHADLQAEEVPRWATGGAGCGERGGAPAPCHGHGRPQPPPPIGLPTCSGLRAFGQHGQRGQTWLAKGRNRTGLGRGPREWVWRPQVSSEPVRRSPSGFLSVVCWNFPQQRLREPPSLGPVLAGTCSGNAGPGSFRLLGFPGWRRVLGPTAGRRGGHSRSQAEGWRPGPQGQWAPQGGGLRARSVAGRKRRSVWGPVCGTLVAPPARDGKPQWLPGSQRWALPARAGRAAEPVIMFLCFLFWWLSEKEKELSL